MLQIGPDTSSYDLELCLVACAIIQSGAVEHLAFREIIVFKFCNISQSNFVEFD